MALFHRLRRRTRHIDRGRDPAFRSGKKQSTRRHMMSSAPVRLLCVDDHRIVREGIALILSREPDITVVATAATADEAVSEFKRHLPDITLMDLRLGDKSGIDAIREIRREYPTARIVVLTMYQGDEDIHRALSAGATTYLLKDALSDDLIRVVREVHAGGNPMPPSVRARLDQRAAHPTLTRARSRCCNWYRRESATRRSRRFSASARTRSRCT